MIDFNELTPPGTFANEDTEESNDQSAVKEWKCRLAGVTFEGRQQTIKKFAFPKSNYELVRQPDNEYDENAILVTASGHDIGYLPKYLSAELAPIIDAGQKLNVQFRRLLINEKKPDLPAGIIVRVFE